VVVFSQRWWSKYDNPQYRPRTHSVKPNCTGSLTADAGSNGFIHRDLVIVDSGKEVKFVSTDAGLVISGHMKKQHTE
jgi:hypothetical protein